MRRSDPSRSARAHAVLARVGSISIGPRIIERAATIGGADLRSLDAIHLASAAHLESDLTAVVAYDQRFLAATAEMSMPVLSPR